MKDKEICPTCKKEFVRERDPKKCTLEFIFEGLTFRVGLFGCECPECKKNIAVQNFQKFGTQFITVSDKKIKIDWSYYKKESHDETKNILTDILVQLGILSWEKEGNWLIIGTGLDLNPSRSGLHGYFTREEDAIEYTKAAYGGSLWSWELCHIDRVIPKSQLIEEK